MYDGLILCIGVLILWTLFGYGINSVLGIWIEKALIKAYNIQTEDDCIKVINKWQLDHFGYIPEKTTYVDIILDAFSWPSTVYNAVKNVKKFVKDAPKN